MKPKKGCKILKSKVFLNASNNNSEKNFAIKIEMKREHHFIKEVPQNVTNEKRERQKALIKKKFNNYIGMFYYNSRNNILIYLKKIKNKRRTCKYSNILQPILHNAHCTPTLQFLAENNSRILLNTSRFN